MLNLVHYDVVPPLVATYKIVMSCTYGEGYDDVEALTSWLVQCLEFWSEWQLEVQDGEDDLRDAESEEMGKNRNEFKGKLDEHSIGDLRYNCRPMVVLLSLNLVGIGL
jgi:hypothetical protein